MTEVDDETLELYVAAAAKALGLSVDPAWMPAIRANLRATLNHAAIVSGFDLSDEAEPAPVFRV